MQVGNQDLILEYHLWTNPRVLVLDSTWLLFEVSAHFQSFSHIHIEICKVLFFLEY